MNLTEVINSLTEERGLDVKTLEGIICEGVLSAYEKKLPGVELRATFDRSSGEVVVSARRIVVATVEQPELEIALDKARRLSPGISLGAELWVPLEAKIGRIEILKARQVIASRIKEIEIQEVYEAFKDRVGTIVHGNVYKVEGAGTLIKIQDTIAFLPNSLSIPGEKLLAGHTVKALLKDVLADPKGKNQLVLDRASEQFVKELFALEIPEIFERTVEIKKMARIPGYKTKLIVTSNDPNIDPVGTCVGVGGSRIKPILKELATEKVDVMANNPITEELVKSALKPAKINRVELTAAGDVLVWVDEDQRSLVVGRGGQNITLAARLLGMNIQLVNKVEESEASSFLADAAEQQADE